MRNLYQFDKSVFGKIMVLLAFSCFAFGCHTGMESVPAPQTTVKKEEASRVPKESFQNNTETNTKYTFLLGRDQVKMEDAPILRLLDSIITE